MLLSPHMVLPAHARATPCLPATPPLLGSDPQETSAVTRPAATAGGGKRLCSQGAPPARCHTPPPLRRSPRPGGGGCLLGCAAVPLVDFFKPCWRGRRAHRTTGCRSRSPAAPLCGYCAPRPGRPSALLRRRDEGAGTQAPTADRYRGLPLATAALRFGGDSGRGGPGWKGRTRVRVPS